MDLPTMLVADVRQLDRDDYGKWRVTAVIGEAQIGQFSITVATHETDTNQAIVVAKSKLQKLGAAMADYFERFPT